MGPAWRQFVTLALLNLAIGSAHAQVASGTTTSSAAAATFTVDVGRADHVFRPDVVQANVGDIIQFNFFPPNHSVVRAEYGYPCIPYEKMVPGKQGFFSGFKPVDAILSSPPTYQVKINDTEPIFFYCSAPGSCIDWQMVGVINPNSTQTLSVQKQFAANASYVLQPGEPFPAEGSTPSPSSGPTAPAYPTASGSGSAAAASSSEAAAAASTSHKSSFPPGAIAGVVVGAVAIIALAAALFYFVGRHRTVKAREAATVALGSEKGQSGGASPVAALPGQPVLGPGGMVYVPAPQQDYNRMSMPPQYPHEAPLNPMTPHSPTNPHYSTVSTYDMSAPSPSFRAQSPPVEMHIHKQ